MSISSTTQKRSKIRPALIVEDDNDEGITIVAGKSAKKEKELKVAKPVDEINSQDHLETKKQIEDLRKEYGDGWLHSQGATKVQDVMGIQVPVKTVAQTAEERLENLFGLDSPAAINRDRTSTPIERWTYMDLANSSIDVCNLEDFASSLR